MKKMILALFITVLNFATTCFGAFAAETDKVVKILAIGNSFSVDAIEQHFYDLAKADIPLAKYIMENKK